MCAGEGAQARARLTAAVPRPFKEIRPPTPGPGGPSPSIQGWAHSPPHRHESCYLVAGSFPPQGHHRLSMCHCAGGWVDQQIWHPGGHHDRQRPPVHV